MLNGLEFMSLPSTELSFDQSCNVLGLILLILVPGHQKIAILIRMQFLNDIIKSRHGFKTAQKFHKFRVLIKL